LFFAGNEPAHGVRLYLQDVAGGKPLPITPGGVNGTNFTVSPDGRFVAGIGPDGRDYLFPVHSGEPIPISGLLPAEQPIGWTEDSKSLYIYRLGEVPAKVIAWIWPQDGGHLGRSLCPPILPVSQR
jgi:hypothetical protein